MLIAATVVVDAEFAAGELGERAQRPQLWHDGDNLGQVRQGLIEVPGLLGDQLAKQYGTKSTLRCVVTGKRLHERAHDRFAQGPITGLVERRKLVCGVRSQGQQLSLDHHVARGVDADKCVLESQVSVQSGLDGLHGELRVGFATTGFHHLPHEEVEGLPLAFFVLGNGAGICGDRSLHELGDRAGIRHLL